MGERSNKNNA